MPTPCSFYFTEKECACFCSVGGCGTGNEVKTKT